MIPTVSLTLYMSWGRFQPSRPCYTSRTAAIFQTLFWPWSIPQSLSPNWPKIQPCLGIDHQQQILRMRSFQSLYEMQTWKIWKLFKLSEGKSGYVSAFEVYAYGDPMSEENTDSSFSVMNQLSILHYKGNSKSKGNL